MFDPLVVHEYIDSTGGRGGPLVTSFNETSRSDLRLYESDGNQTMRDLYGMTTEAFQDICAALLGRMIDTVPSGVQLQRVITPMPIKPINVTWDFDETGALVLSGNVRVGWQPSPVTSTENLSRCLLAFQVLWDTPTITFSAGKFTTLLHPDPDTGSTAYSSGDTYFYPFAVPSSEVGNATSFTVSGDSFAAQTFPINRQVQPFFVPSMSTATSSSVSFTIASSTGRDLREEGMVVAVAAPVEQPLTLVPKIVKADVNLTATKDTQSGLLLWEGLYEMPQEVTGSISLTLTRSDQTLDRLLLDAGVAGW